MTSPEIWSREPANGFAADASVLGIWPWIAWNQVGEVINVRRAGDAAEDEVDVREVIWVVCPNCGDRIALMAQWGTFDENGQRVIWLSSEPNEEEEADLLRWSATCPCGARVAVNND